jgi:23S rRNA G2445 N2-methylase RlmL
MKALAITYPGLSDILAKEIKDITGISGRETAEGVLFEAELEQIFAVCYRAQTACRVILVVSEGKISELAIPAEYLKGTISINSKTTTKANELSENIKANKVYKNADVPFYMHYEENNWLGIDLTGDISKRDYRIFIGRETLAGISAFSALMIAGYEPKKVLLDPNCRAGNIVIEAALHSLGMPARYYFKEKMPLVKVFKTFDFDKFYKKQDSAIKEKIAGQIISISDQFPSVQATRKNAKIAGVVKAIDFSRTSVDWLDLKFDKNSVDLIVTQPVEMAKTFPPEKFKKQALLFFERAKAILKKNGKIGIVLRQGAEEYKSLAKGFSVEQERTIMQGKEEWKIVVLKQ